MSGEQKHPYHLVEPSPWPALGALSGFVLAVGAVLYMHEHQYGVATMGGGLMLVLAPCSSGGAISSAKPNIRGITPIVQIGMRYGMMLFISSEVMFFVAFFWAFFDRALFRLAGSGHRKALRPSTPLICR